MNVSTQSLQAALSAVAVGRVRPAEEGNAVLGIQPRMVVEPDNEDEVAALLHLANERELAVLPRGGGTHLTMGCPPRSADIVLSMARLSHIVEHTPHDQTVTVQAGVRLIDLQAALGTTRQWLALDPPHAVNATIGGLIATNVSGPRRLRYGGVRDQIIGVRVALPDGTIAKGGGKVVKNVAGYDLPKLFTGSLGTLGVIVAASFRLYPLAAASRTVVIEAGSPDPLCDLVLRVLASTLVPSALDVMGASDRTTHACAVRFESGVEAAVDEQVTSILSMAKGISEGHSLSGEDEAAFWRDSQTLATDSDSGEQTCLLKASLLPSEIAGWLGELATLAVSHRARAQWAAHCGHGLITVRLTGPLDGLTRLISPLREAAHARRGTLVITEAPLALASQADLWGPIPALGVMRRIKQRFDPHGILNPGRFVGGI